MLEVYGVSFRTFQNYVGNYDVKHATKDEIFELLDRLSPSSSFAPLYRTYFLQHDTPLVSQLKALIYA